MRVINVIKIEDNIFVEIQSFGIEDEQLSREVVEQAEKVFGEAIREIHPNLIEEEFEEAVAEGYFTVNDQSVCLAWSDV